jgi:hypothetical protein
MVLVITERLQKQAIVYGLQSWFGVRIILSVHLGARHIITTAFDTEHKLQSNTLITQYTISIYLQSENPTHRCACCDVNSQWLCGTSYALHRSPAQIRVVNRRFSMSKFSSNSVSTVAIPMPNFPIMGPHCVELNLAISIQYELCGFRTDSESSLMFVCFAVTFHSKYFPFCRPFCRSLYCAARGGPIARPFPPYSIEATRLMKGFEKRRCPLLVRMKVLYLYD